MVKLTYTAAKRTRQRPHLVLVGKGIMYDSGGISLKPSDAMHAIDEDGHVRRGRGAGVDDRAAGARLPERR